MAVTLAWLPAGAADQEWPVYGANVQGHRYSAQTAITAQTVARLAPAWQKTLGAPVSMEGTPIVAGGTMFVTTGLNQIYALDPATGAEKWSYQYSAGEQGKPCCNRDNRGATLVGDDLVVLATVDAHLIALDQKTGVPRWTAEVAPWSDGYAITSPPLYVDGVLITGMAGGEWPTRGFLAAYDPKTGKEIWRRYTVPQRGDAEFAAWRMAPGKVPHGAPTWITGTFDAATDTVYWGTGNPNPDFDPSAFGGLELPYADSVLALEPKTGRIKWHYNWTPRNFYDFDGVNECVLVDLPMNGRVVKALAHADRDGFLFVLDRTNGKPIFIEPFSDNVTWATIDRTTGVVHLNPQIQAAAAAMRETPFAPASLGGKNWQPTAYDPTTHVFVIPGMEVTGVLHPSKTPDDPEVGQRNTGTFSTMGPLSGSIIAYDLAAGKRLWKVHTPLPQAGGLLVTGGLVFSSSIDGYLVAYDEKTGNEVWRSPKIRDGGITAPPMTYSAGGVQYVAVEVGLGGLYPRIQADEAYIKAIKPDSAIVTFALR